MDRYKRYYGVMVFIAAVLFVFVIMFLIIKPKYNAFVETNAKLEKVSKTLDDLKIKRDSVKAKLERLQESVISSQKKVYSPIESNIGNDTLFFTLYSDLIEMVHANSIKIDSIEYTYNPAGDIFVAQEGKYFVCEVNLKLVSNYVNLGKLIQDLYQYPYYIKITNLEVYPYPKDKKILLSSLNVRLYARTTPDNEFDDISEDASPIDGAETALPQQ